MIVRPAEPGDFDGMQQPASRVGPSGWHPGGLGWRIVPGSPSPTRSWSPSTTTGRTPSSGSRGAADEIPHVERDRDDVADALVTWRLERIDEVPRRQRRGRAWQAQNSELHGPDAKTAVRRATAAMAPVWPSERSMPRLGGDDSQADPRTRRASRWPPQEWRRAEFRLRADRGGGLPTLPPRHEADLVGGRRRGGSCAGPVSSPRRRGWSWLLAR